MPDTGCTRVTRKMSPLGDRYEVGELDNGGIASFSIWETADEAQRAVDLAADFVRDNLADRVRLRDEHTGDVAWDDPA